METKKIDSGTWVIRLKRGEQLIESLKDFCQKNKIFGGFFFGLGAVDRVELAHYNVETKKYHALKFEKPLEMINITGSIGREDDLIIHAHGIFSDRKMQTLGGHLVEGRISGTGEIYFVKTPPLSKKYDSETGLKIFNLEKEKRSVVSVP